jgi:hypothetical protein
MSIDINIDLQLLLKQLENGCFTYLDQVKSNWYNIIHYNSNSDLMKSLHRSIVYHLVKHNKIEALEPNIMSFSFLIRHWVLVFLESIHLGNKNIETIASTYLKIGARHRPLKRNAIISFLKVLLEEADSTDLISFFEWCKKNEDSDVYVCFRGVLLKEIRVWDEDHLPITSVQSLNKFENKFSSIIEYILQMYKEEEQFELTFIEVCGHLRERLRIHQTELYSKYIITELLLKEYIVLDILKYVLKLYL